MPGGFAGLKCVGLAPSTVTKKISDSGSMAGHAHLRSLAMLTAPDDQRRVGAEQATGMFFGGNRLARLSVRGIVTQIL
jgi:hypothetical protein